MCEDEAPLPSERALSGEVLGALLLTLVAHLAAGHGFLSGGRAAEDVAAGGLSRADGLLDLAGGGVVETGAELILGLGIIQELLELGAGAVVSDLAKKPLS